MQLEMENGEDNGGCEIQHLSYKTFEGEEGLIQAQEKKQQHKWFSLFTKRL
jgi:hypothetical protein